MHGTPAYKEGGKPRTHQPHIESISNICCYHVYTRLPYGIVTKLHRIIGWKRMKLNKMVEFHNIREREFESIMRRIAVVRIMARFADALVLDKHGDPAKCARAGIFKREPDLYEFMTSSPAVLAAHKIQYAFEAETSEEECRNMITEYTRCGGDHGVTHKYMRMACGLKPVQDMPTEKTGLEVPSGRPGFFLLFFCRGHHLPSQQYSSALLIA